MNIYEFLNQQSDDRLVLYAIVVIAVTYFVIQGLVYIFHRKKK